MGLTYQYGPGQTPIDDDEKEGLLIRSISTLAELNEAEQLNIQSAIEWIFKKRFKTRDIFSETFVCELHKRMYREVWRWAGEFRKTNKNIGVDKLEIAVHLKQLIDDGQFWIGNKTFSPNEIAIRFKHRIVSIHCFPNGNGRHSRLIADTIARQIFKEKVFT
jgi:Fic-DOC domain mobile mystery protein B